MANENIIPFQGITKLDLDPERVLEAAIENSLSECVVIGFTHKGDWYFSSSLAGAGDNLYHLEKAKHELMKIADELNGQ